MEASGQLNIQSPEQFVQKKKQTILWNFVSYDSFFKVKSYPLHLAHRVDGHLPYDDHACIHHFRRFLPFLRAAPPSTIRERVSLEPHLDPAKDNMLNKIILRLCSLVERYQRFHVLPWRWRQYVCPNRQHTYTRLQSVATRKNTVHIPTEVTAPALTDVNMTVAFSRCRINEASPPKMSKGSSRGYRPVWSPRTKLTPWSDIWPLYAFYVKPFKLQFITTCHQWRETEC